jgi:hypothetical protein
MAQFFLSLSRVVLAPRLIERRLNCKSKTAPTSHCICSIFYNPSSRSRGFGQVALGRPCLGENPG